MFNNKNCKVTFGFEYITAINSSVRNFCENSFSGSDMRDSMLGSKIDSHAIEIYLFCINSMNIFQHFNEVLSCHKEILNIKL